MASGLPRFVGPDGRREHTSARARLPSVPQLKRPEKLAQRTSDNEEDDSSPQADLKGETSRGSDPGDKFHPHGCSATTFLGYKALRLGGFRLCLPATKRSWKVWTTRLSTGLAGLGVAGFAGIRELRFPNHGIACGRKPRSEREVVGNSTGGVPVGYQRAPCEPSPRMVQGQDGLTHA